MHTNINLYILYTVQKPVNAQCTQFVYFFIFQLVVHKYGYVGEHMHTNLILYVRIRKLYERMFDVRFKMLDIIKWNTTFNTGKEESIGENWPLCPHQNTHQKLTLSTISNVNLFRNLGWECSKFVECWVWRLDGKRFFISRCDIITAQPMTSLLAGF